MKGGPAGLASIGLILGASAAVAQPRPAPTPEPEPILVVVTPDDEGLRPLADRLGPAATVRIARALDVEATTLEAALDPKRSWRHERAMAEARALVLEGIAAFEALDLTDAIDLLRDAVQRLAAHLPSLDASGRLALGQGLFAYATSVLFEGHTDEADHLFAALAALEPGFQPDGSRYPSNVRQRFEALRGQAGQRPTGTLEIVTNPAGAAVFIDGGFRGHGPLRVEGLAAGGHAVTARHPAFEPAAEVVVVSTAEVEGVSLELPARAPGRAWTSMTANLVETPDQALQALAGLGASRVAYLRLRSGPSGPTVDGLWLDLASRRLIRRIEPRSISTDLDAAAEVVTAAVLEAEGPPLTADLPPDEPGEITGKWWFWAAVGGVVAAAAASTAVALTRGGDDRPPPNTAVLGF